MPDYLEQLIRQYGYWFLFIGTFLEGETIAILAGIASHTRDLYLPWTILVAFAGSLSGDQLAFFIGRYKGQKLLARFPSLEVKANKVFRVLERHHTLLILGFRFLYGLRNATPFALGMSQVKTHRFILLNVIGAMIWSVCFCGGGYLLGNALVTLFGQFKHRSKQILFAFILLAIAFWLVRLIIGRVKARREKKARLAEQKEGILPQDNPDSQRPV